MPAPIPLFRATELLKARSHKYIRREGSPGHYVYIYREPKKGAGKVSAQAKGKKPSPKKAAQAGFYSSAEFDELVDGDVDTARDLAADALMDDSAWWSKFHEDTEAVADYVSTLSLEQAKQVATMKLDELPAPKGKKKG